MFLLIFADFGTIFAYFETQFAYFESQFPKICSRLFNEFKGPMNGRDMARQGRLDEERAVIECFDVVIDWCFSYKESPLGDGRGFLLMRL